MIEGPFRNRLGFYFSEVHVNKVHKAEIGKGDSLN
jgi:hypothetical protein